jgi:hypothetical protein
MQDLQCRVLLRPLLDTNHASTRHQFNTRDCAFGDTAVAYMQGYMIPVNLAAFGKAKVSLEAAAATTRTGYKKLT